jgi:hypothetical protein
MAHTVKIDNQDVFDHAATVAWVSWFRDMLNFYVPNVVFLQRAEVRYLAEHAGCSEAKIRRLMESLDVWGMVRAKREEVGLLVGGGAHG